MEGGADEEEYDPFGGGGGGAIGGEGSDNEGENTGDKSAVSWSYSKYMKAFDQEEVLNEVDESTFSSLTGEGMCNESLNKQNARYNNNILLIMISICRR